ncbi:hypothetical protein EVAR_91283_1 [Eumeta japonica]|uniref:SAP domain-containing protein n=1 Tax=Eumeta variegata TaxID=151549 RepID=A0A4C1TGD7_EUMVA|nr:hypothetical protein EVAR_91283_1 [Eumeta japonica]
MDIQTIKSLNVAELREKLSELGLNTTGLKAGLQERLINHFGLQDDVESVSDRSEYEDATVPEVSRSGSMFTLKDISDSLSSFSGSDSLSIRQWVDEFEENAEVVGWNNIQKFIYGKQLLKGAARLFVRGQVGLRDWDSLKGALVAEFGESLSSIEIHRLLRNRRKGDNETFREYLYTLMEIGKPIDLDVASLLEYFIEGIPDSKSSKSNLYQAKL